jgi:hypothetical protein
MLKFGRMSFTNFLHHLNRRDTRLFPYFKNLFLLIALFSATFFVGHTLAQNIYQDTNDAFKQGTNQESWLNNGLNTNLVSLLNGLVGEIPEEVVSGTSFFWIPGGLAGTTSNAIASLYQPPASGIQYIAQVKDNFLGKPAYAQGIGFKGLEPLIPIWRNFRNFTYILSSIAFIIIGLLIVLRVKISPQAVISIQNAVPQLVTTLLLITFSYAIAGLLIDLSYVFQAIAVGLIYPEVFTNASTLLNEIFEFFATKLFFLNTKPSLGTFSNPNMSVLLGVLTIPILVTIGLATFIGTIIGLVGALPALFFNPAAIPAAGLATGGVAFVLASLIITIAMLIWIIKFLFGIFKAYAMIIFKIVIAPLEIAIGAFPGSKVGFSTWVLDLVANILVFPISFLFILLSNKIVISVLFTGSTMEILELFLNIIKGNPTTNDFGLWAPQILGGGGVVGGGLIAVGAISISTLFLLSKLPEIIPQFIFMLKPAPWGQAVGQGMGGIISTPMKAFGLSQSINKTRTSYFEAQAARSKAQDVRDNAANATPKQTTSVPPQGKDDIQSLP